MSMLLGRLGFVLLVVLPYVMAAITMQQTSLQSTGTHRPRRFRMDMFLGPYYQHDLVDRITLTSGMDDDASCQPLLTKRFGSFYINDPLVKVTFYRSHDCTGAPSGVFYRSQENVLSMRANSVTVQKVRSMDLL
ncbi:hypothetical protein BX666DRAFT_1877575 [Dichotomocladium elegans]|nr:hypothetical protein BX666DRAFT_1877575 [Dichotomocladium elegans]